ncbi:MAG: thioredoxin family protein [Candidatus Hodarchaeota archaeon]
MEGLPGSSQAALNEIVKNLKNVVKLLVFTSRDENGYVQCPACEDTAALIVQLSKMTDKINAEEISTITDKEKCEKYGVTRHPTILLPDFNIRYTGAPIGLELSPFVQTVLMASTGETILGDLGADQVSSIKKGSLIIIVTPTCPYCAQAVLMENSLAIDSGGKISVEIVEAYENPDIAKKYQVTGVPVTVVNKKEKIVGVPNFALLLQKLKGDKSSLNEMYS